MLYYTPLHYVSVYIYYETTHPTGQIWVPVLAACTADNALRAFSSPTVPRYRH